MRGESGANAHPLVSVVVATNRVSPYLAEALDSVAAQTYPAIEVIVVDDGSPDASAVADATAHLPGARLVRQPAQGVSAARNTGAGIATGAFLVFLDDDDRWHPNRIEQQVRGLSESPAAPLGYCGMQSIDERGRVIAAADQVAVTGEHDVARRATGIILPNSMIRRDAFHAVGGFDPDLRQAEDLDLVLRLARRGPFVFSPDTLVDYRAHAHNTTRRHRELCRSIRLVLTDHQRDAARRGDRALVAAYRESLRANGRYAWWSAMRASRRNGGPNRLRELLWAFSFAPLAPLDAALRRLRAVRDGRAAQHPPRAPQ
jgi:glycosyltransferase involved in cell wall biosynthesis